MKPLSKKKRITFLVLSLIAFFVFLPILFFYALGYSFDLRDYLIVERGGLYVLAPDSNVSIFLNGEHKTTSGFFQREYFVQRLKPDTYQILLQHDEYDSWEKIVEVSGNKVTTVFPFLVPKEFVFSDIASTTPAYKDVITLFATSTIDSKIPQATSTDPVLTTQNRMSVWFEDGQVFAKWQIRDSWLPDYFCVAGVCENPTIVAEVSSPIKQIDFYPGRNDVVIFATDDRVYLVEIDKRPKQVFRSLYTGKNLSFSLRGEMLYILEGSRIIEIEL